MKKVRRITALILVALMVIGLAGCNKKTDGDGSGEEGNDAEIVSMIQEVQDNMNAVESMTYEMDMDIEMDVAGMNLGTKLEADIQTIMDPMKMSLEGTMNLGDIGVYDVKIYVEPEGDQMAIYTGTDLDGEVHWLKSLTDIDSGEVNQYNAAASLDIYLKNMDSFKEVGTEEINGKETVKFEGTITGESMKEAMEASGAMTQFESIGSEVTPEILETMGTLPVTIWIDPEEKMVAKYSMDMTESLSNLMAKQAEEAEAEGEGIQEELGSINFDKMTVDVTITGVNNVDSIEVPEEAKAGAEDMSM